MGNLNKINAEMLRTMKKAASAAAAGKTGKGDVLARIQRVEERAIFSGDLGAQNICADCREAITANDPSRAFVRPLEAKALNRAWTMATNAAAAAGRVRRIPKEELAQ